MIRGIESEYNSIKQSDLVYQNDHVTSFIGIRKWPNNVGHVLTIPNEHYENVYDMPIKLFMEVQIAAKGIALAMKDAYSCDGIVFIQRNEPAGEQRTWHYHLHTIPRYENDSWHSSQRLPFPANERAEYALQLKSKLMSGNFYHVNQDDSVTES